MFMTLDGYGEFPKYPGSDVPSKEPGEGFTNMWIKRHDSVDTGKGHHCERGPLARPGVHPAGLADDYRMIVWPVILGRGKHYWGSMLKQQTLKLLSVKSLKHGELILHYETVRSGKRQDPAEESEPLDKNPS